MSNEVIEFDINEFRTQHPEFNNIADGTLEFYFELASSLLDNDTRTSIIKNPKELKLALYLLVCHIAKINGRNDMIGALTNASEGSVSVGSQIPQSLSQSWLCTTSCGLWLWQLLAKYRRGIRWYEGRCGCCR